MESDRQPNGEAARRDAPPSDLSQGADAREVAFFDRVGAHWWDPNGPMAPLHALQPVRLDYVLDQIAGQFGRDLSAPQPLSGLRVVDLGCGGGLMCEPFARLGAAVTGLDASAAAIAAASAHAAASGLEIDYRLGVSSDLAAETETGARPAADVVLALEIVEHVPDRAAFLADAARLLAPDGLAIATTLNRTARSFAAAIVAAEYVFRWLPVGAHDWRKFPTPQELTAEARAAGLQAVDRTGFVYAPLTRRWRLDARDLSVNFGIAFTPTADGPSAGL